MHGFWLGAGILLQKARVHSFSDILYNRRELSAS
jgi:hypothetical protein